jgi:hypothetical protein
VTGRDKIGDDVRTGVAGASSNKNAHVKILGQK